MNKLKLLLLVCLFFITARSFAQTPKSIENDLLKSFKKIGYWENYIIHQRDINAPDEADNVVRASDSIEVANDRFGKQLKYCTEKYPYTITQKFSSLIGSGLDISTSDDGLFRIYSWDTLTGGTMHYFENVFQYKSGKKSISVLNSLKGDGDNGPNYDKMYTFKANRQTYYLATNASIGSSKDVGQGIQIFAIENGELNDDVKLIKTQTGLHSEITCDYDFFSVVDWKTRPSIYFDITTETIYIPLVASNGQMTHKYITYKFNGQYFEKVKS